VETEPGDEELHAFVEAMLKNLDGRLREPDVIAETIREHRQMWLMVYRLSLDFEPGDS
jgi:hypothetical protein